MSNESRGIDYGIIIILAIVAILVAAGVVVYLQVRTDAVTEYTQNHDRVPVLFVQESGGEARFAQIVVVDTRTRKMALFDVPGRLGTVVESLDRIDRIDTLYNRGNREAYRETVAETFGIEIPYLLSLDAEGLTTVVDMLGGLELFITESFQEEGNDTVVRLPAGSAVLDGAKAVDYARAEIPGEQYPERASRTQKLTQALFRSLGAKSELLTHEDVLPYVYEAFDLALDRRAFAILLEQYRGVEGEQVVSRRVQGSIREVEAGGATQELLFPHFDGRWLRQTVSQVVDTLAQEGEVAQSPATISVEILNGTTVTGLARRTRRLYERYGFDVVSFDNADRNDYENTLVIDRQGNMTAAQRAAEIIRASRVESEPKDSPIDVTIILGRDFDGTYVRQ
jgi:anionic cell wall polymer biosynthesis LytR-Cps2A-Psr (LCP) family protein